MPAAGRVIQRRCGRVRKRSLSLHRASAGAMDLESQYRTVGAHRAPIARAVVDSWFSRGRTRMKRAAITVAALLAGTPVFAQRPSDPALLVPQKTAPLDYVAVADPLSL